MFNKGDQVTHTDDNPKKVMEVIRYDDEVKRVVCRWINLDSEEEGYFREEKLKLLRRKNSNV